MTRISRRQILIETTKLEAKRGTCLRAQVGCVLAIEGRVIATGYNGSPPGQPHCIDVGCQMEEGHCIRTVHAEANAICWAARRGVSTMGATLYTYGWKDGICHRCRKLAESAGIVEIVEIPHYEPLVFPFPSFTSDRVADELACEIWQAIHEKGSGTAVISQVLKKYVR